MANDIEADPLLRGLENTELGWGELEVEIGLKVRRTLHLMVVPLALAIVLSILLVARFTSRSSEDEERIRARTILEMIYQLEEAYYKEHGTYLRIDRGNNADLLKLSEPPGRFAYRVEVGESGFLATARADLDGDGQQEVWSIDRSGGEPVRIQED